MHTWGTLSDMVLSYKTITEPFNIYNEPSEFYWSNIKGNINKKRKKIYKS